MQRPVIIPGVSKWLETYGGQGWMMSLCQLDRSPLYGQLLQSILGEELFLTLLLISVNIKYVFQSQSTVLSF